MTSHPVAPAAPAPTAPARSAERAEIREAAQAFEALLLRQLVSRMREAQIEGGLFGDGPGAGVYEGMFDDFLADQLAETSPLGIAAMLERQWTAKLDAGLPADATAGLRAARAYASGAAALELAGSALGAGRVAAHATPRPEPGAANPAVPISREFGWGTHPILGRRAHHDGLDLAAPRGTPVLAPRAGRVVDVERSTGGYGLQVLVEHPGGLRTRYAHLSRASVRPGQLVGPGTNLGEVGSTGRSTGPHLHFETLVGGRPEDPRRVLGGSVAAQVLGPDADETGER